MNNITHRAHFVNGSYDPDLNRFGLNPHSLIGYTGGSKMGNIEPTAIVDIVSNPDKYGIEYGEWKRMKCGCPFSMDGYAPKGKGIAYKCSANGWFTFRCFDDSHGHPGAKYEVDKSGRGFYSYSFKSTNTNHIATDYSMVAVEFNAGSPETMKAVAEWLKSSNTKSTLMAVDTSTKDNYVIFRSDRIVGFKYNSMVEVIPEVRVNRDFKLDRRLVYLCNGMPITADDISAENVPMAKPSSWAKLFTNKIRPRSEAAPVVAAAEQQKQQQEQQKNQALVEVLEDIDSSAAPAAGQQEQRDPDNRLVANPDARDEHWKVYNRRMMGAEEKALMDESNDITILLAGQQSRREMDERIMREVHAARERVFNVRCRRAPHLVLTWTKNMVGHLSSIDLTCWMASCEDCRPFVLGSLASAVEVYLTRALNAGMVISMATAPSAVHVTKYTKNALSKWSEGIHTSPEDINIGTRVSPGGRRETRVPICANSHTPKNTWMGIQVGDEVVYFFCRHPDGGGNRSFIPPVIAAKGTVLDRFTIQTEHDIATKVTEVVTALDKHIKNQEDNKPEGVTYKYDILFGSMETVKEINYLRHTVTGRGNHSRNKEEAKERRERDGIKDFQAKVVTKLDGIFTELSDMVQTTITTEDPTAGGVFKENKDGKLKMHGINTTTAVNNSIKKGTTKECAPGHNKGKKVRNVIASSKSSGVSITPIISVVK